MSGTHGGPVEAFVFTAMGSECAFHLHGAHPAAAQAAEIEVERIEQRYSRFRPDSILAEINRVAAAGGALDVDQETAALLDYAFACHRKSAGLFDITTGVLRRAWTPGGGIPSAGRIEDLLAFVGLEKVVWSRPRLSFPRAGMELDLGGLCKEYAADRAAAVLAEAGVSSGLVNLGGDLRALGPLPNGTPWTVHVSDPRDPGTCLARFPLSRGGLATSGDYARCVTIDGVRYGHLLSPLTGWPSRGLAAVSVVAETCLLAGSVSTVGMLKGPEGRAWLSGLRLPHLWVDVDGRSGGDGFEVLAQAGIAAS